MTAANGPLGIIAGGGDLPLATAQAVRAAGRDVYIVALLGSADDRVEDYPHVWAGPGEAGKTFKALKAAGCRDIVLVGRFQRPKLSEIKLDATGVLLVSRVAAAFCHGDNAILDTIATIVAEKGFRVLSVAEAAPGLLAPAGPLGRLAPDAGQEKDLRQALAIVRALGAHDVGQAAVVCDGLALAVEAAEGTDAMLARIPALPEHFRGTARARRGVLVKAVKPIQDGRTDLPVIGLKTVELAAAAGLAGIGIEAGRALVLGRDDAITAADRLGLFVAGIVP